MKNNIERSLVFDISDATFYCNYYAYECQHDITQDDLVIVSIDAIRDKVVNALAGTGVSIDDYVGEHDWKVECLPSATVDYFDDRIPGDLTEGSYTTEDGKQVRVSYGEYGDWRIFSFYLNNKMLGYYSIDMKKANKV